MQWLNNNAVAIQAISTVILVIITAFYAWQSKKHVSLIENQNKPKLRVSASLGIIFSYAVDDKEEHIIIECSNIGNRNITIVSLGFIASNGLWLYIINKPTVPLPSSIQPGEKYSAYITKKEINESLEKSKVFITGVFCKEATGETFQSKFNYKLKST